MRLRSIARDVCQDLFMREYLDFAALRRPPTRNTALVAPAGATPLAKPDRESPVFPFPPLALYERAHALIDARSDWRLMAADPSALRLKFVAHTRVLRFRDDVDLAILPGDAPDRSRLAAYSRSRIGLSDLGANARRLDGLLKALLVP